MPKPATNQIEGNIAQDKLIKDIRNLFNPFLATLFHNSKQFLGYNIL